MDELAKRCILLGGMAPNGHVVPVAVDENGSLGTGGSGGGGITQAQAKTATKEAIQEATNLIATEATLDAISAALAPIQRTVGLINRSDIGSITANSVAIANIGSAEGTVEGTSVPVNFVVKFQAPWRDTITVDYDATGTIFLISWTS